MFRKLSSKSIEIQKNNWKHIINFHIEARHMVLQAVKKTEMFPTKFNKYVDAKHVTK